MRSNKIGLILKGSEDGKVHLQLIVLRILPLVLYSKQSPMFRKLELFAFSGEEAGRHLLRSVRATLNYSTNDGKRYSFHNAVFCSQFQTTGSAQKSILPNKIFG
jgi:hypothetical protein